MLSAAAKVIANNVIGFGATAAMTATAKAVLGALGIPEAVLDPLKLLPVDPDKELWLPQEVGVFNLVMAFRGQVDIAVQSLLADLRWMETAPDWHNSAARFLFDDVTPPATGLLEACSVRLNHAQEIALDAAAHNPLTVITGPPGTGKSQTVTAIVAEAWRRGESVVLSSTNNRPVDDVVNTKATDIDAGLMLRTGNKEVRGKLSEAVYDLLPEVVARQPEEGAEQAVQVCASQRHLAAHVLEQRAKLESGLLDASLLRDELRALVWEDRQPRVPITEIDKRAAKAVRTRWKWLRRRRAAKLREVAGLPSTIAVEAIIEWTRSESVFDSAWQTLGAHQRDNEGDLLDAFQQADMRWRAASRVLTSELVRRGYTDGAEHLKLLADKLSEELPFREVMTQVLRHVHGWATSTLSTRPSFDCRAGSIDLVVIDEASQCTLAQILPLAFRAKRLVIVGDADQLPPVITATPERLRALATDAGASHEQFAAMHHTYGEHSAFDAFAARFKPEPLLLNEHYRCHPDIIRFCNEEFYDGKLVVLSEVDDREDLGLTWIDITGVTRPGRTGSVVNEFEVDAVVNWLAESELDLKHTGVVTPFRAQANMIERALAAHPDERLRAVEVGTAHTFQGGERETILFSTVISTDAQPGTIGWLESQRNLVNVAVSRAKHRLIVFGDALAIRTRGPRVLRTLAETATATATGHATTGDVLTDRVRAALTAKGIPSRRGQLVQGYPVEIAITGADGELIDVEISRYPDGDTGARQQRRDAVRDTRLRGLGWRVVRVPGWQAYLDPAAIIDQVRTMRDPRT
ncbi:AAA domain-containing protein [Herbihabitans rhizosphaerae]|nr:AAA domain-containing protein [Herbihabitans rhizosphaerae]